MLSALSFQLSAAFITASHRAAPTPRPAARRRWPVRAPGVFPPRTRCRQRPAAAGRDPSTITLLAVSKTKPVEMIRTAHAAGQIAFGENYLQDALPKIAALQDLALEWHYIGRIQSNKTRDIARHFAWVHGIDRLKHAQRISEQRQGTQPPLQCCIQVNLSGEATKETTKAFKTITRIVFPPQYEQFAYGTIGVGDVFGLPATLSNDAQVLAKTFNGSVDAGTVTTDADEVEKNVFNPAGSPDGSKAIELLMLI